MRFDHIGVVVTTMAAGQEMLAAALRIDAWTEVFEDEANDVFVQFGRCPSGICYELVAPRSPASPIQRALRKGINTLNHVAYLVTDLAAEGDRLRDCGFIPVGPAKPAIAYGMRAIQFFLNDANLLIELIEAPDHRHAFRVIA